MLQYSFANHNAIIDFVLECTVGSTELPTPREPNNNTLEIIIAVAVIAVVVGLVVLVLCVMFACCCFYRRKSRKSFEM